MIESVYFSGNSVPSDRLLTALGLYYDRTFIPLLYMPDEPAFGELFARLPIADQRLIRSHAALVERFRGLAPNMFDFPTPFTTREDLPNADDRCLSPSRLNVDMFHLLDSLPPDAPTALTGFSCEAYAVGFFHGFQCVIGRSQSEHNHIVVPISDHDVMGVSLYPHKPNAQLADVLASWLATETIQLSLPDLEAVHPAEIIWAKDRLQEELAGFRSAMYGLATSLRSMLRDSPAQAFLWATHHCPRFGYLQARREVLLCTRPGEDS